MTDSMSPQHEWDERFRSSDQLFSGKPNGSLVAEVSGIPAGRVLDVGCGEGADAIWLAQQGWTVTALDVSAVALERAATAAAHAGVEVEWVHARLGDALEGHRFDLVTVHYPALPSSPNRDNERTLLAAVAPGGVLLMVYHADFDGSAARFHGFDPADYVGLTDVIAALLAEDWHVVVDTRRLRDVPAGGGRHTHDVVLRAQRSSVDTPDHDHDHDRAHHHSHTHHDNHAHHDHGDDGLRDMLELDAQVLEQYWTSALTWVAGKVGSDPTRVVDLGAGVGTGAIGLSEHFPGADVVAVDIDPESLKRLAHRVSATDAQVRVRTLEADLNSGWPDTGPVDLTWASMSMHHFADPDRVLRDALSATAPGGLFAIAEFSEFVRFLPEALGVGRPGLEDRIAQAMSTENAHAVPELGSIWATRLRDAGWTVVDERDFLIDLDPPRHPRAGQFADGWFRRLADGIGDRLDHDDRATLDSLLNPASPHALVRRTDLHIRGIRTVTVAQRGSQG